MKFPKDLDSIKLEKYWKKKAENILLNKKIVRVEYLSKENLEKYGWYKRPIVFWLDDGTHIQVQCDDEGNDGGVLYYMKSNKDNNPANQQSLQGSLPVL